MYSVYSLCFDFEKKEHTVTDRMHIGGIKESTYTMGDLSGSRTELLFCFSKCWQEKKREDDYHHSHTP
ncbi:unnamed protein product [Lactuca virosa]|uniref:Uncharacterized protein n=1 Tax=Lactuca virosa TaxID=75947 RepID=A0AAU9MB21_9ASTR|nr:unnamed protein product [Lactuca virosa]